MNDLPDAAAPAATTDGGPWAWRTRGAFDEYSRDALHAATLAFSPFGTVLYASFALLDALYVPPDLVQRVWALRGAVTVLLLGMTLWMRKRGPTRHTELLAVGIPTLASLSVVWMTTLWDPGANGYAPGIVLCVLVFGFLTRMPLHALVGATFVLATYVTGHFLAGPPPPSALVPFGAHTAFIAGAGVLAVLQSYTAHVLRHATFTAKRETEALNASLESQVAARTAQLSAANEAFLRFVPAEFLRELGYEDITRARLGDACERRLTVMFSDIRSFTTLAERLPPEEVFGLLNQCLAELGPPVRLHGGFIDKYVGDAIMALFPRSPADAVRAAVDMQRALEARSGLPLSIGVGIHTGDVVMGTIGEEQRFEATVIADAVNLAARLESMTRLLDCRILISRDVHDALDAQTREGTRRVGRFAMKGKSVCIDLFDVFTSDSAEMFAHKAATRAAFEAALVAYVNGDAAVAYDLFARVVSACPQDGAARWWAARAERAVALGAAFTGEPHVTMGEK